MKIALETMLSVLLQLISSYALCTTMLLEVHVAAGDITGSNTTNYRIVHGVTAAIASLQPIPIKLIIQQMKLRLLSLDSIILLVFR